MLAEERRWGGGVRLVCRMALIFRRWVMVEKVEGVQEGLRNTAVLFEAVGYHYSIRP